MTLPGLMLVVISMPIYKRLVGNPKNSGFQAFLDGVNAASVGILWKIAYWVSETGLQSLTSSSSGVATWAATAVGTTGAK
ncbi:hypothetical protein HK102_010244, partial [Quaeritorhiza haematococci]